MSGSTTALVAFLPVSTAGCCKTASKFYKIKLQKGERTLSKITPVQKGFTMFDMREIGLRIARLRKAKNMTQMELADHMNISFQAVSNWERGNSMPDISKLPELAELFGVTIDEILGKKAELIDSASNNKIDEYLANKTVTTEQIEEAAPILKPTQVDEMVEKANVDSLDEMIGILPFVSETTVDELIKKALKRGDYTAVSKAIPFASDNAVDSIAEQMVMDGQNITPMAPFISEKALSKLASTIYKQRGFSDIISLAPFISEKELSIIAEQEYEKSGLTKVENLAPFLSEECLEKLAKRAVKEYGIKSIRSISVYINDKSLDEYIKDALR